MVLKLVRDPERGSEGGTVARDGDCEGVDGFEGVDGVGGLATLAGIDVLIVSLGDENPDARGRELDGGESCESAMPRSDQLRWDR